MAYGESNGHVLDDVTCPVFLLGTVYIVTKLLESMKLLENIEKQQI